MGIKKISVAVALLLVAGVGVVGWRLFSDEPDPGPEDLTAEVVHHWISDFEAQSAFPEWWTDGVSLGWFGEDSGDLSVRSWSPDSEVSGRQWWSARTLAGGRQVKPLALAVTPGDAKSFVAVGMRPVPKQAADQPVLVWTGSLDETGEEPKVDAIELPVTVDPTTDSKSIIVADAAVVTLGDETIAAVQISQGDTTRLLSCIVDDGPCDWQPLVPPVPGAYVSLGATSDALIAIADAESPTVWAASDPSVSWKQVGLAPRGFRAADVTDGIEKAVLVWPSGDDVTIQTVDDADVKTEVARLTVPDDPMGPFVAVRQGDRWYLGAAAAGDPEARLAFDARAAGLWVLADQTWRRVTDPLLIKQIDQRVVALRVGAGDELLATTASFVLDTVMFWMFTPRR